MRWTLSVFSCHTLSLLAVCLRRPAPEARSPGRNLSVASRGQISPTPKNPDGGFRLVLRQSGVVQGEIWTGGGGAGDFIFASIAPAAISGVLSCLFVHYPCIIRQTIIPLCFASVVQMLTGNESSQRLVGEEVLLSVSYS